jgi:DNA-binding transcriptional ArsR family regulator
VIGESTELAPLMQALSDPTRIRVVEMLSESPQRAGELAKAIGVSAPVMSKHLRVLLGVGMVADERPTIDARARVFRLRPESVAAVGAWLAQVQGQWDQQLAAFRAHVERKSEP